MASPAPPEDQSNTKTGEGTTAFHKKRSRRVSFAENTSVHFFDRDEDFETPPDPEPPSPPSGDLGSTEPDNDVNNEDDDDMDESGPRMPFFRLVASPSSGGSSVSAASNDEDNFFGPVSTNFIKRDLLDSATSDDNHDQTMDSTAFSRHYHSLARSDSEDLKTSTRVNLSFEDQTPTSSSIPSGTRNTMQLTLVNKPNSQLDVSTSKLSSGSQSNDMSLVGEYHDKYDYAKLSPAMDPLLAEIHNDLHLVSHISMLKSPIKDGKQNGNGPDFMDFSYGQDNNIKGITSDGVHKEVASLKQNEMGVADDGSKVLSNKQTAFGVLSNTIDTQASKYLSPNQSITDIFTVKTNEPVKDAFGINSSLENLVTSQGTPVVQFKSPGTVTPVVQIASISSIQKSMSKLRNLAASPISAALNAKIEDSSSRSRSLVAISKRTPLGNLLEKEGASTKLDGDENRCEVALQPVLPSKNTGSGEHMHQTVLRSPDITYGYKDVENKIGFLQTLNSSSKKLKKETTTKLVVSSGRDEEQPIHHNELLEFGSGHVESLATASEGKENLTPVNVAGSNIKEKVHERRDFLNDAHNNSETKGNLTNLPNNMEHEKFQSVFRGSDASLALNGRMDEKSCYKNLADQFGGSPSNKELNSVLHNENNETFPAENVPSERKRKAEHVTTDKITKVQRSLKSGLELPSDDEMPSIGPSLEHLTEIHTRFFKETKLFSQSVEKMNLHVMNCLDDILGQLQRANTYQLISDEIRSQNKIATEMKLLLCKFVHEQAKLQLMRVKQDRLLKNTHSLASGIRESETLKKNLLQYSLDAQVIHQQSLPDNRKDTEECQVEKDKLTLMAQAMIDTDRRISDLTKSFHISCKMKGEPNTADTIAYVNTYMKKRAQCQIIRKDMQLWVIDSLKSSKNQHDVVLNYLDLVSQRLTVTTGVAPRIAISNTLNQENIHKNFRDIDASKALGFVFDTGLVQKHATASSMAQETQTASSLLGNLVNVMEEIQVAKLELMNLRHARFHTSLDERLDLELYFFDSKSRKKATITLNASCLKRGIYPAEIVAFQIDVSVNKSQTSFNEKLSAEIAAAVQDLRVGVFRILRLCKCISQLVSLQDKK